MTKRILIVLTSVSEFPDGSPTGWYCPEAVHPYYKFTQAGYDVEFASINGTAVCDPSSLPGDDECVRFMGDNALKSLTENNKKVNECTASDYDAVFFAGGFGTMWDFPESEDCQKIISDFMTQDKIVAAVCHAPIVFKNIKASNGTPLLQGKEVTGFTNAEENAVAKYDIVSAPTGPGTCEDVLGGTEYGGIFKDGGVFQPNVCVAGKIMTGQNPPSAGPLAEAIIKEIQAAK